MIFRYLKVFNYYEKIQARGVMSGLIVTLAGSVIFIILKQTIPVIGQNAFLYTLINVLSLFWTMILPFSIVLAILRSHIWDIDLIIRRTIIYAVLTGILLAFYFGSVVLIKTLVESVTGAQSLAISVVIMLIIAVLFSPLQQRIQKNIDRIFYRKKYDKSKALEFFRQSSRDEVDIESLSGKMLSVINDTVQPQFVSIWVIKKPESGQTGLFPSLSNTLEPYYSVPGHQAHEDTEAT